jgi:VWFA-related protein
VRLKILTLVIACAVIVPLLQGQNAPGDEIRFASQPYVADENGTIRVQSTNVDMNVVVRDANGRPVSGLNKEDFQIFDQGKRQTISSFNVEYAHAPEVKPSEQIQAQSTATPPVPPRYLAMYFDDTNMSTGDLAFARKAAIGFVSKNMDETDRGGVFTSSTTVTQQFTSSKQEIIATLGKLQSHQHSASFGSTVCPKITPYEAFQINATFDSHSDVFDAAVQESVQCHCQGANDMQTRASCTSEMARMVQTQAATVLSLSEQFAQDSLGVLGDVIRYLGKMPGRRMLIMTSSGFFSRTEKVQHTQDKMIDAALRAGIVINTMDAKALAAEWLGGNPTEGNPNLATADAPNQSFNSIQQEVENDEREVSNDSMSVLASATGGKFFHNNNDLDRGLVEIAAMPDVSYSLAFSPDDLKENGVYHTLRVKIPGQKDISISARPGYFARSNEKNSPGAKFQKLNKEVMTADTMNEIPADVSTQSSVLATGESALKVAVHVNARNLAFKKENDARAERVIFITALFDQQGHFLAGTEGVMELNLRDATFAQISKDGIEARATLQAPPGTYRLREVVQDVVGGKLGASSRTVEIH